MNKNTWAALLLTLVFVLSFPVALVVASDVTGAQYRTTVTIGNNGTAATNVATTFSMNSTDLIAGGMANATAEDIAMVGGGADIAIMPGINGNPWATFVSAIGASGTVAQYLYHGDVTGGKIRYFPGAAGMSADDSATIEPGDNFTIEISGWIDTTAPATYPGYDYLFDKPGAIYGYISGEGEVTAVVVTGNATVTSYDAGDNNGRGLAGANWEAQTFIADNLTNTNVINVDMKFKRDGASAGDYRVALRETTGGVPTATDLVGVNTTAAGVDVTDHWIGAEVPYRLATNTTYAVVMSYQDGSLGATQLKWREHNNAGTYPLGARYYSTDSGATWLIDADNDFMFRINEIVGDNITATGVSSGEMTVAITANVTHLSISVDGSPEGSTALTANVTDNAADWAYCDAAAVVYMDELNTTIDGTVNQRIAWQYATTFTDRSGNGNDTTPTFRTASSDADVWGYVSAQVGVLVGTTPTENVSGGWTMVDSVPATPEDLFAEGGDNYSVGGINIGERITTVATDAGYDPDTWHFLLAYGVATLAMAGAYKVSRGDKEGSTKGSLLAATIAGGIVMAIFYRFLTIPGWTLIPYGLLALLIVMWRKSPSPVD